MIAIRWRCWTGPAWQLLGGWECDRFSCAPQTPGTGPVAMWWGTRQPSGERLDALCRAAAVVSVRPAVRALPPSCEGGLVLDGIDYARGGAVELRREGPPATGRWRAVWSADVRGDRPWSRPSATSGAVSDSGG